jgi:hypothetical protein
MVNVSVISARHFLFNHLCVDLYLAEIEKMHAEVIEYLGKHASETESAEAA